jgi:hypothetical protein
MLEQVFQTNETGGTDRIVRILSLTKRLRDIQEASNQIRYDEQLVLEIPEVMKTLGAARDAVIAELKTV